MGDDLTRENETSDEDERERERLPPARHSGALLHPTSLPGSHGIGDLGRCALDFIEWLAAAGQTRWQLLPLGPTGHGDSPYSSFSAFAGNPLLVSLDLLAGDGLLDAGDLSHPGFPSDRVDYGAVVPFKLERLERAADRFHAGAAPALRAEYERFLAEQATWLDDYALFMAIASDNDFQLWSRWPRPLALREPAAIAEARVRLAREIAAQRFMQFAFFRQWNAVRERANALGIQIIGDIPIFVALDSADVWANREEFQLDEEGQPIAVAGVPPDYFSATGQLWGNPLYDWEQMRAGGYAWWVQRFRAVFNLVDIARIDHFRGFQAYWSVPAGAKTAQHGEWVPGPGRQLFDAVRAQLGHLPVVAEDLGLITPDVDALRASLGFPGMSVLQFAFGSGSDNFYLPHNHARDTVVYTGTHDNDTTAGWWASADEATRHHAREYLRTDGRDIVWDFIRGAWASVGETAIVPVQDLLSLGSEARMNLPGQARGNWGWRLEPGALTDDLARRLAGLTTLYGREGVTARERHPRVIETAP